MLFAAFVILLCLQMSPHTTCLLDAMMQRWKTRNSHHTISCVTCGGGWGFDESFHGSDREDVLSPMFGMKQVNPLFAGPCSHFSVLLCLYTFYHFASCLSRILTGSANSPRMIKMIKGNG